MKMRTLILLVLICSNAVGQNNRPLLNLHYGRYAAGLRQQKISYNDSVKLLVTIWQPVKKSLARELLPIKEYIAVEQPAIIKYDSIVNDIICGENYKINPDSLSWFLNHKTNTYKNGSPVNKKFPVLIWASRHGTSHYQLAMCEYLASHGYIIFNGARLQPVLPLPWEVETAERSNLLQFHLKDMDALFAFAKNHPQADTSKIAVLSWSYGASAAVFTQQAHPEVDLVLGFSSINFKNDFFTQKKFESLIDTTKIKVPYLLFYESVNRFGIPFTDSVLHPVHKNISRFFRVPNMLHGNFNYLEGYATGYLNLPKAHPWTKTGKEAIDGYEIVNQLSLLLLNHYFKNLKTGKLEIEINRLKNKYPNGFTE